MTVTIKKFPYIDGNTGFMDVVVEGIEGITSDVLPPPPAVARLHIYVRTGGSDTTGDGSLARPYASTAYALRQISLNIPPNTRYIVDVTGMTEDLGPDGLSIPAFSCPVVGTFTLTPDYPAFAFYDYPIQIQAIPQPASTVPLADTIIAAGEIVSQIVDPISKLSVITTTKVWPVNALQGKYLVDSSFFPIPVPIASNTANTLTIAGGSFSSGGAAPQVAPLTIVEPSYSGSATAAGTGFPAVYVNARCPIAFNGLKLRQLAAFAADLQLDSSNQFSAMMLDANVYWTGAGPSNVYGLILHAKDGGVGDGSGANVNGTAPFLFGVYAASGARVVTNTAGSHLWYMHNFIIDGVAGHGQGGNDAWPTPLWWMQGRITGGGNPGLVLLSGVARTVVGSLIVEGCAGPGIGITAGGFPITLSTVKSQNNAGPGVLVAGGGQAVLNGVTGAGNTGRGLDVTGVLTSVLVDAATVITGAGGDLKVGSLAARTWADFRAAGPTQFIELDAGFATGKTQSIVKQ